jgi:hypothetical protein
MLAKTNGRAASPISSLDASAQQATQLLLHTKALQMVEDLSLDPS